MPPQNPATIDKILRNLPSFGHPVVRPNHREGICWWSPGDSGNADLLRINLATGTKTSVPLPDDHPFDGWEPIHFLSNDVAIVSAGPKTKLVNLDDGSVDDVLPAK